MHIELGVDTLTYHCRLVTGGTTLEDVLRECADLGYTFVQFNARHLLERSETDLAGLRSLAGSLGLRLTLAGDVLGSAAAGDTVDDAVQRVHGWARIAAILGSPYVRLSSGFYRGEVYDQLDLIRTEQRYVIDALRASAAALGGTGIGIVLENHSDFTPDEYVQILEATDDESVSVFLDVINPITMLMDPLPVVERLLPWARSGHVKDFRFASRYVEDGAHRRGWDVNYCYPGEGIADLTHLIGAIADDPRSGEYLLSVEGLDNYPDRADQYDRLGRSIDVLRGLLKNPAREGQLQ